MGTRAERTVRPASSVSRTAGERCEDILVLAQVWVRAIPRLARAGWFMVGALTLIVVKGIAARWANQARSNDTPRD